MKLVGVYPFISNKLGSIVVKRDRDVKIRTLTVRGIVGWGTIVELAMQRASKRKYKQLAVIAAVGSIRSGVVWMTG